MQTEMAFWNLCFLLAIEEHWGVGKTEYFGERREWHLDERLKDIRKKTGLGDGGGMNWEIGIDMYTLICIN